MLSQTVAQDTTTYASPALRAVIERAAAVNAAPPADFRGYSARYESEVALVKLLPDRIQGASTIEQTAGIFTWLVDSGYGQHQLGYRVVTTGVPLPGSAALSNGWIIPTLTGPKIDLFGASSGAETAVGADSGGDYSAWSPLGPDRETVLPVRGRRHRHHRVSRPGRPGRWCASKCGPATPEPPARRSSGETSISTRRPASSAA